METLSLRQELEDFIQTDLSKGVHNNIVNHIQSNFPRAYILGECYGIMLHPRGVNDLHICFTLLVEGDGYWGLKKGTGGSSYWLPDLREQLFKAEEWCKMYALPDLAEFDADERSIQYGYKFKQID